MTNVSSVARVLACLALFTAWGCTPTRLAPLTDDEIAEANMPLDCSSGADCAFRWRRAHFWIAENASLKIQTASDVVIETYNAPPYSAGWAFRATREPRTATTERITLWPSCGPSGLCREPNLRKIAQFHRYVRAAQ